ncbi:CoA transferase subunit B [Peribacillus saganii]|uniref:CoA transferase subunit B n=1 Tax=Peribacillus saganii TaxID=2303992 RepID=A0A372LL57_9BACI|nr:3-oxoacid CoA-transferase subunit B [Peribacillus saganii]RFU66448.1 CoA transferase subunit B [Peribacillus saganii]
MGLGAEIRNKIAKRAAEEIEHGMLVNLGIGIPSLVPNHLPSGKTVMFHAENGITGMGPSPVKGQEDSNLCNAGGYPVTLQEGASYCDSATAFGMIRSGKIDITILGALQVSGSGDLANWIVPGKRVPGMGGAMDLAAKAKKVIVVMNHCDKNGSSKIVEVCTLPLTAKSCVQMVITEMAVFEVTPEGLLLSDIFSHYSVDEIRVRTEVQFGISESLRTLTY